MLLMNFNNASTPFWLFSTWSADFALDPSARPMAQRLCHQEGQSKRKWWTDSSSDWQEGQTGEGALLILKRCLASGTCLDLS